ncbi:neuronal calcium sensor 2-like [Paramacrobiotus metropolitanus]|uniref:neuronal calcium sensor 2-like n=1 Tax=Paramacrobiotus metropolitanus TaxID=2943436 RepID=UPI0024458CC8|nr:neuronal calcium sensor 2-like [Paramacrobiotus metropolitanus]
MGGKNSKTEGGKPKLTKSDLEFLRNNTTFDETTIREWHAGFYRDCPDGKLSPHKFVEVYKVFFPSGDAQAFCEHVFRTFDQDKSGFIDFKEFLLAINVTSSGTAEQKLKWAFRMYDIDSNGHIDLPEMTKIIKAIQEMLGTNSSASIAAHDTNGVPYAHSAEERAKQIFSKMDTNSDGILDEKEFVEGCLNDKSLMQMLTSTGKAR